MPVVLNLLKFVGAYMGLIAAGMTAIGVGAGTYEWFDGRHALPPATLIVERGGASAPAPDHPGLELAAGEVAANAPLRFTVVPDEDPQDLSAYDGADLEWVVYRDLQPIKRVQGALELTLSAGELVQPTDPVDGVVPHREIGAEYRVSFTVRKKERRLVRKRDMLVQSLRCQLRFGPGLVLDPQTGAPTVDLSAVATPSFQPEPGLAPLSTTPAHAAPGGGQAGGTAATAEPDAAPTPGLLGALDSQ